MKAINIRTKVKSLFEVIFKTSVILNFAASVGISILTMTFLFLWVIGDGIDSNDLYGGNPSERYQESTNSIILFVTGWAAINLLVIVLYDLYHLLKTKTLLTLNLVWLWKRNLLIAIPALSAMSVLYVQAIVNYNYSKYGDNWSVNTNESFAILFLFVILTLLIPYRGLFYYAVLYAVSALLRRFRIFGFGVE